VSISIHDSKVHHGDLEAVVFYRTSSTSNNSEPMESLTHQLIERDEDVEWQVGSGNIFDEVLLNANREGKKTVSIGSTFRNVGEEKISCYL